MPAWWEGLEKGLWSGNTTGFPLVRHSPPFSGVGLNRADLLLELLGWIIFPLEMFYWSYRNWINADEESLLEAGVQFTFPAISITHSYKNIYNNVCAPCVTRNITVTSAVSSALLASGNEEQTKAHCKCRFSRECPKIGVTGICHVLNHSEDMFAFFLLIFACYSQICYH